MAQSRIDFALAVRRTNNNSSSVRKTNPLLLATSTLLFPGAVPIG
jgi:hypothetical protein